MRLLGVSRSIGTATTERGPALRALLTVFALVAPLIPIHGFFAIPLSAIAGVAMLLVLWRVRPVARPAEEAVALAAIPG